MNAIPKNQLTFPKSEQSKEGESFKKWIFLIISHWYLFAFFLVLGCIGAYMAEKMTVPVYKVSSSVLIKPEQPETRPAAETPTNGFEADAKDNFVNQTILLKTPSQIKSTLDELNFNICYFASHQFNPVEYYPDYPFKVVIDSNHVQPLNVAFHLKAGKGGTIWLAARGKNVRLYNFKVGRETGVIDDLTLNQEVIPGKRYATGSYSFSIEQTLTPLKSIAEEGSYYFLFKSNQDMIDEFSDISMDYATQGSSVVNISHSGTCLNKSIAFLNQLMEDMIRENLDKKNQIANNTIKIINKQLAGIGDTLHVVTNRLQQFKTTNKVVQPDVQAQSSYIKLESLETELTQLTLQKDYLDQLKGYLNNREDFDKVVAPSSVGLDASELSAYLKQLSEIRAELVQYMGQSKLNNPYLVSRKKQEAILMSSIQEYVNNLGERINLKIKSISKEKDRYTAEQRQLPAKEKELVGIERSFKLTDNLYTMLREKGIEAQIKRASNVADNQIVEKARFTEMVKPQRAKIYGYGLLIGLILPMIYLFIADLFNNKIVTHEDLEQLTHQPVIGIIPENRESMQLVTMEKPDSPISEAFRALRTRISFNTKGQNRQTLLITSSVAGEGKTFCAMNLAGILALSGKKTILLGFDLRKPQLHEYLSMDNSVGITSYLMNEFQLEEVIQHTPYQHLDCIVSGPIQPNPAELIQSEKTVELFKRLKKMYEYIVVDSSPVGPVTDALLLAPLCNFVQFVVRHRITVKHLFAYNINLLEESGITQIGILMNDVKTRHRGYGYGYEYGYRYGYGYGYSYGYGYGEKEKRKTTDSKRILTEDVIEKG